MPCGGWANGSKKSLKALEQEREDVVQKRLDWWDSQESVDASRLVFLDETGLKTNMVRRYGWAQLGERLVDRTSGGHWETNTLIHAVALDGTRGALVLDGPVNSVSFTGFCEQILAPNLDPGDLVILDNLSSHKSIQAQQAVEKVGASLIFLPPYSPDLNPIENLFSKLKQLIRGLRPKTWDEIVEAARKALQQISLIDIANAVEYAGYAVT